MTAEVPFRVKLSYVIILSIKMSENAGNILLVDDEPGLREAVQAYLEDSGFTVKTASNAQEGWDLLQKETPDVLISDIMMPQVDGYAFLAQVRDDIRFKGLPVLFFDRSGNDRRSHPGL